MSVVSLSKSRINKAKRAFTTRRVPIDAMRTLITGYVQPAAGDLVLATVQTLGKHCNIELPWGRRAMMMPGDEIVVCYGNRYAPDQYEALVSQDLGLCDLVAGGGIAAREVCRHGSIAPPTQIVPIGLVGDAEGKRLNIANFAIAGDDKTDNEITVVVVAGTAMNAGKTHTAASIIHGLKASGAKVAGIKATGTGSGGDLWKMKDMGADIVMDFTDVGLPSTYKAPDPVIEAGALKLIRRAAAQKCQYAVVEIADGLQHQETATLLRSEKLRSLASGAVFAAYDSLGAAGGYKMLTEMGYPVLAISGQITRSPLAMREATASTGARLITPAEFQAGALVSLLKEAADAREALLERGSAFFAWPWKDGTHAHNSASSIERNDVSRAELPTAFATLVASHL